MVTVNSWKDHVFISFMTRTQEDRIVMITSTILNKSHKEKLLSVFLENHMLDFAIMEVFSGKIDLAMSL